MFMPVIMVYISDNLNLGTNELWTLLFNLRPAYYTNEYKMCLKTKSNDAIKDDWRWFVHNKHPEIVFQLSERLEYKRLVLRKIVWSSQRIVLSHTHTWICTKDPFGDKKTIRFLSKLIGLGFFKTGPGQSQNTKPGLFIKSLDFSKIQIKSRFFQICIFIKFKN